MSTSFGYRPKNMWMTDEEIIRMYRQAKDPVEQIEILAQLNGVKTKTIVTILTNSGLDVTDPEDIAPRVVHRAYTYTPRRSVEEYEKLFRPLYEKGFSDTEIGRSAGTTVSPVRRWREYYGLPANFARTNSRKTERSVING